MANLSLERVDPAFGAFVPGRVARNAVGASGRTARQLARQANYILGRCGKVLPGKAVVPQLARVTSSDSRLWLTRYHASPNATTLVVDVHLAPTPDSTTTPQWYVKVDGTATARRQHNVRCDPAYAYYLGPISGSTPGSFVDRMEIAVVPNMHHTVELWTSGKCVVLDWELHEKERESLTPGTDKCVDWSYLAPGADIRDTDLIQLVDMIKSAWENMRGAGMSWNADDHASPFSTSSTAFASVFANASITTTIPTKYRQSYANNFVGDDNIGYYAWVFAERTAGAASETVRFTQSGDNVDITVNGGLGIYSALGNLSAASDETIRLQAKVGAAANTLKIYAAGCFPFIT